MLSNAWAMLVFVVKLSSFAKGQNPKPDTHNQKLGCAPKKCNSAISVRKKKITYCKIIFLSWPAHTESKGKNRI